MRALAAALLLCVLLAGCGAQAESAPLRRSQFGGTAPGTLPQAAATPAPRPAARPPAPRRRGSRPPAPRRRGSGAGLPSQLGPTGPGTSSSPR